MSLPANFLAKTRRTDCTVWIGAVNTLGYGVVHIDGRRELAHRIAYEDTHGPIPEGMFPDHVCRVRNCVNPAHLELVTTSENVKRGRAAVGGICTQGHELVTEADVYVRANGKSECMECRRIGRRANRRGEPRPTKQRRAERVATDLDQLAGAAS